jgi:hypothetical protein
LSRGQPASQPASQPARTANCVIGKPRYAPRTTEPTPRKSFLQDAVHCGLSWMDGVTACRILLYIPKTRNVNQHNLTVWARPPVHLLTMCSPPLPPPLCLLQTGGLFSAISKTKERVTLHGQSGRCHRTTMLLALLLFFRPLQPSLMCPIKNSAS